MSTVWLAQWAVHNSDAGVEVFASKQGAIDYLASDLGPDQDEDEIRDSLTDHGFWVDDEDQPRIEWFVTEQEVKP